MSRTVHLFTPHALHLATQLELRLSAAGFNIVVSRSIDCVLAQPSCELIAVYDRNLTDAREVFGRLESEAREFIVFIPSWMPNDMFGVCYAGRVFADNLSPAELDREIRRFAQLGTLETERIRHESHSQTVDVLVVDDEPSVSAVVAKLLEASGYSVLSCNSAEYALQIVRNESRKISVVLTDLTMPGTPGWVLADQIRALRPEIKVLYMTGYTTNQDLLRAAEYGFVELLEKPFSRTSLIRSIESMLAPIES